MREHATGIQQVKPSTAIRLVDPGDLFDRMQELYDSIARRAYEFFEGRGRVNGFDLDDWLRAESELLHPVHLELTESNDALTIRVEVPSFSAKDLQVSVEPRRVLISGKRETGGRRKTGKTVFTERRSSEIFRALDLPADVDPSKITTTFKDGVLELEMPKATPAKRVQVETKVA